MKSTIARFLSVSLFSTLFFVSGQAIAQEEQEVIGQDAEQQEQGVQSLDEIIVTARKRDESLQDIPVTISVIGADVIEDAGVNDLFDLFGLVAGVDFEDPNGDRNGANPAIRGVQAGGNGSGITNRRANTFIDGLPLTGQQGTIRFIDTQAVEFYSGPQSAAFGRATFAGAINYVTRDPGEEFDGSFQAQTSSLGRNAITASFSGPINDRLGYTLDGEYSRNQGPSDFQTTEGFDIGRRETNFISGKLVWDINDRASAEFRYLNGKTNDSQGTRFVVDPARITGDPNATIADICSNVGTLSNGRTFLLGEVDCNFGDGSVFIPTNTQLENLLPTEFTNHLRSETNDLVTIQNIDGTTTNTVGLRQDQVDDLLRLAQTYTIPDGPEIFNNRQRISAEFTFDVGNGLVQVLGFWGEEDSNSFTDADLGVDTLVFDVPEFNADGVLEGDFGFTAMGMGATVNHMANPNSVIERYIEARYVSPDAQRLRWSVGGSYSNFFVNQLNFDQFQGVLDPSLILGNQFVDQGVDGLSPQIEPTLITNEGLENFGLFFNITYDITDRTTFAFEARLDHDTTTNDNILARQFLEEVGQNDIVTFGDIDTTSKNFLPRISLTHAFTDEITAYAQAAIGISPGAANPEWLTPDSLIALRAATNLRSQGVLAVDETATGEELAEQQLFLSGFNFDETTYTQFEEEQIVNLEAGIRGTLFDGDVNFTTVLYAQNWTDQQEAANVSFDVRTLANGDELFEAELDQLLFEGPDALFPNIAVDDQDAFRDDVIAGADFTPMGQTNLGDSLLIGIQQTAQWRINNEWSINGQMSIARNRTTDICNTGAEGFGFLNDSGVEDGEIAPCRDLSGTDEIRTPSFAGSLSASYRVPLFNTGLNFTARADARHTGQTFGDIANLYYFPSFTTYNVNLGVNNRTWNLTLSANNILDDDTPRTIRTNNADTPEEFEISISPPNRREFSLRLRYNL